MIDMRLGGPGSPPSPSPYQYETKCFVFRNLRGDGWGIKGHRWGYSPYDVGEETDWFEAIRVAQRHVRQGGLAWPASLR